MCWVTTIGTGKSAGSAGSTLVSASGPPVEQPIASDVDRGRRARAVPAGRGRRRRAAPAARRRAGRDRTVAGRPAAARRPGGPRPAAAPGPGGRAGRRWRATPAAERVDLRDELLAYGRDGLGDRADVARLGDVVGGAGGQRLQRGARARRGQRAEHDHRELLVPLAQLADRGDAVHLRHLDVHRDHVGLELVDLGLGQQAVRRPCRRPRCPAPPSASTMSRRTTTESSTTRTEIIRPSPFTRATPGRAPRPPVRAADAPWRCPAGRGPPAPAPRR